MYFYGKKNIKVKRNFWKYFRQQKSLNNKMFITVSMKWMLENNSGKQKYFYHDLSGDPSAVDIFFIEMILHWLKTVSCKYRFVL